MSAEMDRNMDSVTTALRAELAETPYACTSLDSLSGGNANFVFRGRLKTPLQPPPTTNKPGIHDERVEAAAAAAAAADEEEKVDKEILIKHGEPYVRQNTSFSLPTSRCEVEATTLSILGDHLAPARASVFTVRTPKLHHFNPQTNTQIQEYLPRGIDLKSYCLKYFEPSTSPSKRGPCLALGQSLGSWLRNFHTWTGSSATAQTPARETLRETAAKNKSLQILKNATYYQFLAHQLVDMFPDILGGETRSLLEELEVMAAKELEDANNQVVHGDFWTGNILLPDLDITSRQKETEEPPRDVNVPVFVVDWEVTTLGMPLRDVGQMVAELYMLSLFKNITAGEWIIEGFLAGYGKQKVEKSDEKKAFRTLIHIGAHLVVIGGTVAGWPDEGKEEKAERERVVAFGRDMIVKGWEQDRAWFETSCPVLGALFDVVD